MAATSERAAPVPIAAGELAGLVGRLRLVSPPLVTTPAMASEHPAVTAADPAGLVPPLVLLSLTTRLLRQTVEIAGIRSAINYGVEDVRIGAPCPVGASIVMDLALERVVSARGGVTASWRWLLARPGGYEPLLQGNSLSRYV